MKIHAFFISSLLIFVLAADAAACMWLYEVPVCASWTQADAVFLGKVIKIEDAEKSENLGKGMRKIRFQVQENFKGADNPTFTLFQSEWITSCHPDFKKGETWVVFARNDIVVKSFTPFRGFSVAPKETSADLEALRNIVAGKSQSHIVGQFVSKSGKYSYDPIEIAVTGGGMNITAKTDAEGRFDFPVPYGNYRIELKLPYKARIKWDENLLGTSLAEGVPTVFKYDVRLNDGDCHFGLFEVSRQSD